MESSPVEFTALTEGVVTLLSGLLQQLSLKVKEHKDVDISVEEMVIWLSIPMPKMPKTAWAPSPQPNGGVSPARTSGTQSPAQKPGEFYCVFTLTRGKNEGGACGRKALYGGYCKTHAKKMNIGTNAKSNPNGVIPTQPAIGTVPAVQMMPTVLTTGGVSIPGMQPFSQGIVPNLPTLTAGPVVQPINGLQLPGTAPMSGLQLPSVTSVVPIGSVMGLPALDVATGIQLPTVDSDLQ